MYTVLKSCFIVDSALEVACSTDKAIKFFVITVKQWKHVVIHLRGPFRNQWTREIKTKNFKYLYLGQKGNDFCRVIV